MYWLALSPVNRGICWSSLRRVNKAKSTTIQSWAPLLETRREHPFQHYHSRPASSFGIFARDAMLT
jgi:hypothetical protein